MPDIPKKRLVDMSLDELKVLLPELARGIQNHCSLMGIEDPRFALVLFNDPTMTQLVTNVPDEQTRIGLRTTLVKVEQRMQRNGKRLRIPPPPKNT